jgi:outer membrane autotransporter protein
VEADSTVKNKIKTISSNGPASSDARTMALAHASGIDSGTGDDYALNTGTVFVKASPRVLSATRTFGQGGVNGEVGIELAADAQGIAGGDGNDVITNEGELLVSIGDPTFESTIKEEITAGTNTFTDTSLMGEEEAIVGKWIRVPGDEYPDFFTQVVAFDKDEKRLTLRDTFTYDLPLNTSYTLLNYGNKQADITMVNATVGGNTQVDVSTAASVRATGIEGGDGDDGIMNSGAIDVKANNLIQTVSFEITGTVNAESDIESEVSAIGIAGDGKEDISTVSEESAGATFAFIDSRRIGGNTDTVVGKRLRFITGNSADLVTSVEAFDPETGMFTLLDPIPEGGLSEGDIYILGGGSNWIENEGVIDVSANSSINAVDWSLSFGSAVIEASGSANADSIGLGGGHFGDFIENRSLINTQATSGVLSLDRTTVFFGGVQKELVFEAVSNSAGMSTGSGDDMVVNGDGETAELSVINVSAVSKADVNGVTTTFININETNNFVETRTVSNAMGIDLGEGQNDAYNTGQVNVFSESTTIAKAISEEVCLPLLGCYQETNARANATATVSAFGIGAEDGGDKIQSSGNITVEAKASADSEAQGSDVIGGSENDITSVVTEDSDSGSFMFIDESLDEDQEDIVGKYVRFLSGANEDFTAQVIGFIPVTGTIIMDEELPGDLKALEVDDDGNIITPADEYTLANGRDGESGAFANAFATGISLDIGLDNTDTMIEIGGTLHVKADAKADSEARAFYNGKANAGATAVAEARGIATGDGNDLITTKGEIDVTAIVTTESNIGVPEEKVLAIGIETGAGDDTIINIGSIITGIVLNEADPVAGVGILAGAGNDTVILENGSLVTGDVDLGSDDDTLHLIGSPVVNGNLLPDGEELVDTGIDSLIFEGEGFFANPLDGFNRATKQGIGTYAVPDLPTMQWLEVTEGTLQTESDYDFDNEGIFQTIVQSDGTYGKLHIVGSSVLAGELNVLRGQGVYVNGTLYDIIESTGEDTDFTETTFSNIYVPASTTLLSFNVNLLPKIVEVEVNAESFTTVATNRVELAIAKYLDRITPTATGDLSYVIGEFQVLSMSEFGSAFASLSPSLYDISTRTTYYGTQQYTTTLLKRIHSLQLTSASTESQRNAALGKKEKLLAYNGPTASIRQLCAPAQKKQAEYGVWLDGFGQWGDQDGDDGFPSYDFKVHGMTIGFDRMFRDNYIAGISIGFSGADIDVDRDQADGDIDTVYSSLYGSYYTRNGYIDGALSYGGQDYYNKRQVVIGPIQREAWSEHDGDMFSAFTEGGYNIDVNTWVLQPFVSLFYINLDEEGFAEKGADSVNLIISDRETESLVSELGLRVSRLYELNSGIMIPELGVAWNYDFDIDDRIITAAFAGSPNSLFSMEGQHVEKNGVSVGAGITLMNKSGLITSVKYSGEFRDSYSAHGIIGELRHEF